MGTILGNAVATLSPISEVRFATCLADVAANDRVAFLSAALEHGTFHARGSIADVRFAACLADITALFRVTLRWSWSWWRCRERRGLRNIEMLVVPRTWLWVAAAHTTRHNPTRNQHGDKTFVEETKIKTDRATSVSRGVCSSVQYL
jgi:hypothetical protein